MPHVATPYIIHTVKDLDIWTIQVDNHIYQFRDFDDVLIEIGRAAITGGKHVTVMNNAKTELDVTLSIEDVVPETATRIEAGGQVWQEVN